MWGFLCLTKGCFVDCNVYISQHIIKSRGISRVFSSNIYSISLMYQHITSWKYGFSFFFFFLTCDSELLCCHDNFLLICSEEQSPSVSVPHFQPLTLGLHSLGSCRETCTSWGTKSSRTRSSQMRTTGSAALLQCFINKPLLQFDNWPRLEDIFPDSCFVSLQLN